MTIAEAISPPNLDFLWLEITGRCQLECTHCYAESGPGKTHGTMTVRDWTNVIDQAADAGVCMVQFIGGEPTLHPDLPVLIDYALAAEIEVEIYSNLVHVPDRLWATFRQPGVRLATSYYSDDPAQHMTITRRNTLPRTEANIERAVELGIPLRVGIIDLGDGQCIEQARSQLADLGVTNMGIDRMRLLGRPAQRACNASELCGRCGDGIAAVLPDGTLSPCPLSRWLAAGNVTTTPLTELAPRVQRLAATHISPALPEACKPPCEPQCNPGCNPGVNAPGGGGGCQPKMSCNPNQPCKPNNPCQPDVTPKK
ncbi:radical SAM protein [Nonomuraea montanisoli]|uniref:radical SAM protein n=1 Tax=Nonomuraea montanisoli TaxID=2741721 RepID=UPI002E28EE54|nr:radical SAM protein [Nonomuraea montanisoli]